MISTCSSPGSSTLLIDLVFDALTKPEHMSRWFPPSGCEMKECTIDLRVGGEYHQVS